MIETKNLKKTPESNADHPKRIELWEEVKKDIEEIEDLDWKIKELVIGLNVVGLDTRFSCEGHDKGVSRITATGYMDKFEKWHVQEVENSAWMGRWSNPYVGFVLRSHFCVSKKGQKKQDRKKQATLARLQSLINEFYQEHSTLPETRVRVKKHSSRYSDYMITVSDTDGTECIGGTEDHGELARKATEQIEARHEVILAFSQFLKKKYVETGFHT